MGERLASIEDTIRQKHWTNMQQPWHKSRELSSQQESIFLQSKSQISMGQLEGPESAVACLWNGMEGGTKVCRQSFVEDDGNGRMAFRWERYLGMPKLQFDILFWPERSSILIVCIEKADVDS